MALDYITAQTVMLQLGDFQFGISTAAYQELNRSTEWRWPTQERFGKQSSPQFTGPADDTIDLPGVIYPEWRGGFDQLDQMRAMAGDGEPLQLVDGDGASMGRWVILRVTEGQTVFASAGKPRRVEFAVSLLRFPDAEGTGLVDAAEAANSAGASATDVSVPADATSAVSQVQGLANSVSSAAKSLAGTLAKASEQVQQYVAPITSAARDALGAVSRSLSVVEELQSVANTALSSVGARAIETNAMLHAENLAARADRALVNAQSASAVLRTSSAKLDQLSNVPATATKAMQTAQAAADRAVTLTRQTATQAATIKG